MITNDFSNLLVSRILVPPPPLVIQFIQHKPMIMSLSWNSFISQFYFLDITFKIDIIHLQKIHPFKIYNSVVFSIFRKLCNHHNYFNSKTFSSSQMEMPYPSFFLRPLAFTYFLDVSSPWNWGASLGPAFRPNESRLQAPSVLQDARASPLLAASGRPQCVWATFRLPAHRLVGVWVVSAFWLLGVVMLWVFVCSERALSALLGEEWNCGVV